MPSRDEKLNWTVGQLDDRLVISMYAHQASGMEMVAAKLSKDSGDLFARGQDDAARMMRTLAKEISAMAAEQRKKQEERQKEHDDEFGK